MKQDKRPIDTEKKHMFCLPIRNNDDGNSRSKDENDDYDYGDSDGDALIMPLPTQRPFRRRLNRLFAYII